MSFANWLFQIKVAPVIYVREYLSSQNGNAQPFHQWMQYAVCGKHEILQKIRQSQRHPEEWRVTVLEKGIKEAT